MSDHCECCGVKYTGEILLQPGETTIGKDLAAKWKSPYSSDIAGKICIWCASVLPLSLVEVAIGKIQEWEPYTLVNYKSYPKLAERIKSFQPAIDMSKYNTTCKRCGAPAYIGLMSVKCSNPNCSEKKND